MIDVHGNRKLREELTEDGATKISIDTVNYTEEPMGPEQSNMKFSWTLLVAQTIMQISTLGEELTENGADDDANHSHGDGLSDRLIIGASPLTQILQRHTRDLAVQTLSRDALSHGWLHRLRVD